MKGPLNFTRRLLSELESQDLPPFKILHPSDTPAKRFKGVRIARLDGAYFYKASAENLANLIRFRRPRAERLSRLVRMLPIHESPILDRTLNRWLNRHNRRSLLLADAVAFQSHLSVDMHRQFVGQPKTPWRIIYNGVPTDLFRPPSKDATSGLDGSPRMVTTAYFRLHKRLQDQIQLVSRLAKRFPKIRLHVVGELDLLTQEALEPLDLSFCVFHGRLPPDALPTLLGRCDVGLFPSLFDPCPNSVIEMMACGLPVITTTQSGAAELVGLSDLCVPEPVSLDYLPFQTCNRLPQIPFDTWESSVCLVLSDRTRFSEVMRSRAEALFDIKIIAQQYAEFIRSVAHDRT